MDDVKLMIDNYWSKFNTMFPKIKQEQFISWINEDYYTGWEEAGHDHSAGRRELKMLYVMIRATKPRNILEIGTYKGDSSNHVLLAADMNSREGHPCSVTLIDIKDYLEMDLHDYPYNRVLQSSLDYLKTNLDHDFVIQDGSHTFPAVSKEIKLLESSKSLKYIWAHDYHLPGRGVKLAWDSYGSNLCKMWTDFKEDAYPPGFIIAIV